MLRFILRKLAGFLAIVLVTCAIVFACLSTVPGTTPAGGLPGWVGRILIGDFGTSAQGDPIGGKIAASLGVTLPLAVLALILATTLGAGAGYLAWRRHERWPDRLLTPLGALLAAVPSFWLGMLLVLLFALLLHWLPAAGFLPWQDNPGGAFLSLILPAIALALPTAGSIALGTRHALVETAGSAPIIAARTRGLSEDQAMRRYGLRSAALSIVDGLGTQLAALVAGTVIVESVFYLPGLGRLIIDAVVARDVWLVGGGLVILVLLVSGTTFLTRFCFASLNPKLRAQAVA